MMMRGGSYVDINLQTGEVCETIVDTHLNEQIKSLGWIHQGWGAEGEYLQKGIYRLQIIDDKHSIINSNYQIPGTQNLQIFTINYREKYFTLFFGYCDNIETFKTICNLLKIDQ